MRVLGQARPSPMLRRGGTTSDMYVILFCYFAPVGLVVCCLLRGLLGEKVARRHSQSKQGSSFDDLLAVAGMSFILFIPLSGKMLHNDGGEKEEAMRQRWSWFDGAVRLRTPGLKALLGD